MNETLLVLKLNGNKICNKGALAIAGSLQVNTILQELDMADTDMVSEWVQSKRACADHPYLELGAKLDTPFWKVCHFGYRASFSCMWHVLTSQFSFKKPNISITKTRLYSQGDVVSISVYDEGCNSNDAVIWFDRVEGFLRAPLAATL